MKFKPTFVHEKKLYALPSVKSAENFIMERDRRTRSNSESGFIKTKNLVNSDSTETEGISEEKENFFHEIEEKGKKKLTKFNFIKKLSNRKKKSKFKKISKIFFRSSQPIKIRGPIIGKKGNFK